MKVEIQGHCVTVENDKVAMTFYFDLMKEGKDELNGGLTYDHWYKWPRFGWYILP